jgi:hypothetical protein
MNDGTLEEKMKQGVIKNSGGGGGQKNVPDY